MTAVVTLTPAPVVDRTYSVTDLVLGKVNRAGAVYEFLSGKGLNVARTLHSAGRTVGAILPIGRDDEHVIRHNPQQQNLHVVPIAGRVRVNISIVEAGGRTTNVNQHAVPIAAADWDSVIEATLDEIDARQAEWLVVCGSFPVIAETGVGVDLTALLEGAHERGARVALDTSGSALQRWGRHPLVDVIKPNADELASLVERDLLTFGDVIDASRELIAGGLKVVLASLGGDGALAITADSAALAAATAVQVVNTTGAGDAFLAGFLSAATPEHAPRDERGLAAIDLEAGLLQGASFGAHAVAMPTTVLERLDEAPKAQLLPIDPSRQLAEATRVS